MAEDSPILGIIVGGGPAPGLNGVIASATVYAIQLGFKVLAIHDGYKHLASGDPKEVAANVEELTDEYVRPLTETGGSIIRPSRYNPTNNPHEVHNVVMMLQHLRIKNIIIIGGNDKIATTHLITQGLDPAEMQVICIPKTIDNDIQLPYGQTTFGFHSARKFCSELVKNLSVDARSAPRWFIVETMGKASGHLALSVAEASGAHVCIIPEDFGGRKITLQEICDIFEGAVLKRYAANKPYGVAVISEGLINSLEQEEVKKLFVDGFIKYNSDGTVCLDEAEISRAIRNMMNDRLKEIGLPIRVNPKKIGYELRSLKPVSFDTIYSRELGYAAVEGLRQHHSNCIVVWANGIITFKSFRSLMNPEDGKIHPRLVDIKSQNYKISREYGWQIKQIDIDNKEKVEALAKIAKMSVEDFHKKFDPIADKSYIP